MKIIFSDVNAKIYFDSATQNHHTYLGAEDGYNILKALSTFYPHDTFYLLQDTDNYKELRDDGILDKTFPNHNVVFYTDELIEKESVENGDIRGRTVDPQTGEILTGVKRVLEKTRELRKSVDGVITPTNPYELLVPGYTRNNDNFKIFDPVGEYNRAFYANWFLHQYPELPLLGFHVDERFVYPYGKIEHTNRIPDLIMGFENREIKVNTPKYEYPNGTVSRARQDRKVQSIFGYNDAISLLNFRPSEYPELKLGNKENFFNESYKNSDGIDDLNIKIFYNQLKWGAPTKGKSPYTMINRLETFKKMDMFDENILGPKEHKIYPSDFQIYTNLAFNDKKIIDKFPDYFNQSLDKNDMINEMVRTKYTLIIGNSRVSAMSQKIWEALAVGVIPFYVQRDDAWYGSKEYTTKMNDFAPEILGVSSFPEMLKRVQDLESHPEKKRELVDRLMSTWDDKMVTGQLIAEKMMENFKKITNVNYPRQYTPWKKPELEVIEGPKLSGKTTHIQEDINKNCFTEDEYLILHSNSQLPNDYRMFSDQLDLNFTGQLNREYIQYQASGFKAMKTRYEMIDNEQEIYDLIYDRDIPLKKIYIDRSFVSEFVYGTLWKSINLGIITTPAFKPGSLKGTLMQDPNIDIDDIKDLIIQGQQNLGDQFKFTLLPVHDPEKNIETYKLIKDIINKDHKLSQTEIDEYLPSVNIFNFVAREISDLF